MLWLALLIACGGGDGPADLSDPGPSIPPATGDAGPDDDDAAPDDDDAAPDDDDAVVPDDDDAVVPDDDDGGDPIAPCGPWVEPGPGSGDVSSTSGAAMVTPPESSGEWAGCEVRRLFDGDGAFICEHWWQVTGTWVDGVANGDAYRLSFAWVEGLSSCPDDGADVVLRYAVQPLPEQEINLYRSDPMGEPLWFWMTRGDGQVQGDGSLVVEYRTGFVASP